MPIHHHIDRTRLSNHFYLYTTHRHTLILCIVTPGWVPGGGGLSDQLLKCTIGRIVSLVRFESKGREGCEDDTRADKDRPIQMLDGMGTRYRYRVDDGSRWRIVARELDTDPCPSSITTWRAYLSTYTPTHAPLYFDTLHRDAALDLPEVRRP
jgi:hypothetical protein